MYANIMNVFKSSKHSKVMASFPKTEGELSLISNKDFLCLSENMRNDLQVIYGHETTINGPF